MTVPEPPSSPYRGSRSERITWWRARLAPWIAAAAGPVGAFFVVGWAMSRAPPWHRTCARFARAWRVLENPIVGVGLMIALLLLAWRWGGRRQQPRLVPLALSTCVAGAMVSVYCVQPAKEASFKLACATGDDVACFCRELTRRPHVDTSRLLELAEQECRREAVEPASGVDACVAVVEAKRLGQADYACQVLRREGVDIDRCNIQYVDKP